MTVSERPFRAAGIPEFHRIIADSDLDGLCAAAVLPTESLYSLQNYGTQADDGC